MQSKIAILEERASLEDETIANSDSYLNNQIEFEVQRRFSKKMLEQEILLQQDKKYQEEYKL